MNKCTIMYFEVHDYVPIAVTELVNNISQRKKTCIDKRTLFKPKTLRSTSRTFGTSQVD